jgi:ribonuclease III
MRKPDAQHLSPAAAEAASPTPVAPVAPDPVDAVEAAVGRTFADPDLVRRALTHASVAQTRVHSNERMEFLGDAVLGLVCCELIFQLYPDLLEGEMTKIKSTVVSRQTCAAIAKELGFDRLLMMGKGMMTQRTLPQSLAAATFEAVLAALYLDGGLDAARAFLLPLLDPFVRRAAASGHQENFKSVLQQHAQQRFGESPTYVVLDEKGPDHSKCFEVCVEIAGRRFESVWGASKKQSEQQAAFNALTALGVVRVDETGLARVVTPESAPE